MQTVDTRPFSHCTRLSCSLLLCTLLVSVKRKQFFPAGKRDRSPNQSTHVSSFLQVRVEMLQLKAAQIDKCNNAAYFYSLLLPIIGILTPDSFSYPCHTGCALFQDEYCTWSITHLKPGSAIVTEFKNLQALNGVLTVRTLQP